MNVSGYKDTHLQQKPSVIEIYFYRYYREVQHFSFPFLICFLIDTSDNN